MWSTSGVDRAQTIMFYLNLFADLIRMYSANQQD